MRTLFIGVGTGRCGTMSLTKLIDGCLNCSVTHELDAPKEILYWNFNEIEATKKFTRLISLEGNLVGDVAFYYLNYLEYFHNLTQTNKMKFKVICMERDKQEVINSYMKKTSIGTMKPRNHWIKNPEKYGYISNIWDKSYPKFDNIVDKRSAIGLYWDLYYNKIRELAKKLPILIIDVKTLNDKNTQKKIFDFLEIPEKDRVYKIVDENKLLRG